MSFDALAWAGKCQPGSAPRKLVLLALADRHNTEEGVARPSIAWLSEWTGLNRKTVIASLDALEAVGLISDSGMRTGKTGQVKAYRLNLLTVPKTEQSQKRNGSTFTQKQSQKRDTEPTSEPVVEEADASPTEARITPEHVIEAWNDTAERHALPKARLTPERRKKLNAFIRRWSIDDITGALAALERSPFLLGQGPSGWRANIDFLLQPSSFTKLIEGTYGH